MKFYLKNIGKISSALIDIDGITVLSGENDTGKSTVSHALSCVIHALYSIEDDRIFKLQKVLSTFPRTEAQRLAKIFVSKMNFYKDSNELIKQELMKSDIYTSSMDTLTSSIKAILNISKSELFAQSLARSLKVNFYSKIKNIFIDDLGEIKLQIGDDSLTLYIDNNNNILVQSDTELSVSKDVLYMDNLIDTLCHFSFHLKDCKTNKVPVSKMIYDKLSFVCDGDIVFDTSSDSFVYKRKNDDKMLPLKNLSKGILCFDVLKKLVLEELISYDSILIIEKPEQYLHPKWQILFAEVLVLLHKEFNVHILLNTYSPYILDAIETYSKEYNIQDKCKYYLAQNIGDFSIIKNVTNSTENIYSELAAPFQYLENISYSKE